MKNKKKHVIPLGTLWKKNKQFQKTLKKITYLKFNLF